MTSKRKRRRKSETQEKLAKEALAKEEANAAELRKALTFAVYEKDFQPANTSGPPGTWDFKNYLILKCTYQNTSGKDIRAFTGRIRFTDLFDKEVLTRSVTISDPVTAGTTSNDAEMDSGTRKRVQHHLPSLLCYAPWPRLEVSVAA